MQKSYPTLFESANVLDIGSRDFNGSNRYLFTGGTYTGVDSMPGPNVDLVSRAHEIDLPDGSFDMIVSTEMLEHDQFRAKSLARMVKMLKTGGHLLITCAAPGRPVHGIDEYSGGDPYYQNVDAKTLLRELGRQMHCLNIEDTRKGHCDLYYFGRKL